MDTPRVINEGVICSSSFTTSGHVLGTSGSSPGDSGSPVLSKAVPRELLGMVVGAEDVPVMRRDDQQLVVAQQSRAYIVPSIILLRRQKRK